MVDKPNIPDAYSRRLSDYLGTEVVREFPFCADRKWRFDYCIPEARVAIEIEGAVFVRGRHTRPVGFLKDMEKYNTAAAMGWTLLRFTPETCWTPAAQEVIRRAYEHGTSR